MATQPKADIAINLNIYVEIHACLNEGTLRSVFGVIDGSYIFYVGVPPGPTCQ